MKFKIVYWFLKSFATGPLPEPFEYSLQGFIENFEKLWAIKEAQNIS
jgi:hypothetical protein